MDTINSWTVKALEIVKSYRGFSHDKHRQVAAGAFQRERLISLGVNRLPEDIQVTLDRQEKPFKYDYMLHAEEVLILNAMKNGTSLEGCACIVTLTPCLRCTRLLIEAGIKSLFIVWDLAHYYKNNEKYKFDLAKELLNEKGVEVFLITSEGVLWDKKEWKKDSLSQVQ